MPATIYIAGPMRGYHEWNFPAFDEAAEYLRSVGHEPISPAHLDRLRGFNEKDPSTAFSREQWWVAMRRDYAAIILSDALMLLPGWERSEGARLERSFAEHLGIPIFRYINSRLVPEQIIGFCGYAQSGKDAAASMLVALGWERRAFADPLKEVALAMNPMVGDFRLQSVVDTFGWEGAKKSEEVRRLLQRLGTEGGRRHISDDVWVRAMFSRPHHHLLTIPDVRFEDEAEAIRRRGGIVVRVNRPGVGPVNEHSSEKIPDHDLVIENTESLSDLATAVTTVLDGYASVIAERRSQQ